mmetsp:Transcript_73215/g.191922  ORF Transcript_73215/g.191922 Transcript_73215/m.191922 type:complete len:232 (-) Transcript_73215:185-880(-)
MLYAAQRRSQPMICTADRSVAAPRPLHEQHATQEDEEGAPLGGVQGLPEQHHAQQRGGEDLQLVRHLLHSRAQLQQAEEHEIVLHRVEQRGHADLQRLEAAPGELLLHSGSGRAQAPGLHGDQEETHDGLHDLREEHDCAGKVGMARASRRLGDALSRPLDDEDLGRSLRRERDQRDPFHRHTCYPRLSRRSGNFGNKLRRCLLGLGLVAVAAAGGDRLVQDQRLAALHRL